jgi:thiamine biosynthesis lipoprotein
MWLAGCGDTRLPEYEFSGPVMGTSFSIKLVDPPAEIDRGALGEAITARLERIEQRYSTYRPTSELSVVNATLSTDWIGLSPEMCDTIEAATGISRRTNGAFDVTVGPLVLLWGFGPDRIRTAPPPDGLVAEARSSVGYDKIETDCTRPALRKALPGVYIDLSAFVKGHAVDQVADLLDAAGIANYLVEIGGELRMRGHNAGAGPWDIAIEMPDAPGRGVQSVLHITDHGMATSGDYRNFFEYNGVRYSHTIDPATGRPVTHNTAAVTVVNDTAAEADALATALLVMGASDGMDFAAAERIAAIFLLRTDNGIEARPTPEFNALLNR